jgi:hypothetical protein
MVSACEEIRIVEERKERTENTRLISVDILRNLLLPNLLRHHPLHQRNPRASSNQDHTLDLVEGELGSVESGLDRVGEAGDDRFDAGFEVRSGEFGAKVEVVDEAFDLRKGSRSQRRKVREGRGRGEGTGKRTLAEAAVLALRTCLTRPASLRSFAIALLSSVAFLPASSCFPVVSSNFSTSISLTARSNVYPFASRSYPYPRTSSAVTFLS